MYFTIVSSSRPTISSKQNIDFILLYDYDVQEAEEVEVEAGAVGITHAMHSSRGTAQEAVTVVSLTKEEEEEARGAGPVTTAPVSS